MSVAARRSRQAFGRGTLRFLYPSNRKVIAYLNDEVVPKVRQNSSDALRIAADHLRNLADHLERR